MELRQLRHFLALAEEQNFIRAAQRERVVQSGLSLCSWVPAWESELLPADSAIRYSPALSRRFC